MRLHSILQAFVPLPQTLIVHTRLLKIEGAVCPQTSVLDTSRRPLGSVTQGFT